MHQSSTLYLKLGPILWICYVHNIIWPAYNIKGYVDFLSQGQPVTVIGIFFNSVSSGIPAAAVINQMF